MPSNSDRHPTPDRRAQYLVAGSNVPSTSETSDFEDEEEQIGGPKRPFFDQDDFEGDETSAAALRDESFVGQLNWDEDDDVPKSISRKKDFSSVMESNKLVIPRPISATEQTPLLAKRTSRVSFSELPHPAHFSMQDSQGDSQAASPNNLAAPRPPSRRTSTTSVQSTKGLNYRGQSTYGQTVRSFPVLCV